MLVVDDEPGVRAALTRGLGAEGMDVVAAGDGPTGLAEALGGGFDAIVLDIVMPGLSGYRVLERLRAEGDETPVLLLSAKDGEVDQADGLDLGADGYLVKPFSFVVLVAQLRAMLRRRAPATSTLVRGPLRVEEHGATWHERELGLAPRELAVLHTLAARPGAVVTKDELLAAVWGDGAAARNVVEVYVGYLRRKLAAVGADGLVVTERGRGYRVDLPS
ncbi:response regulator transcription factor [Actinomycetospora termitidis]|uniref:Response regulator transcription factor n=1 Tax=Actinomycetospora termitidis TaxID=3053470 RepID=A0ABT7M6Y6_9PSEU|nr:response regulator transcription factor [Actinomycetospora sp. Odt1-22]MDL5156427.1 response regulator transcription factor [Actinomycetospora sp. Odt1-22]